jgi:hypothetical protein
MTETLGNSTSLVNFIFSPTLSEDQYKLNNKDFTIKNKCRLRTFCEMFMPNAEILLTYSDAGFYQILHEM